MNLSRLYMAGAFIFTYCNSSDAHLRLSVVSSRRCPKPQSNFQGRGWLWVAAPQHGLTVFQVRIFHLFLGVSCLENMFQTGRQKPRNPPSEMCVCVFADYSLLAGGHVDANWYKGTSASANSLSLSSFVG